MAIWTHVPDQQPLPPASDCALPAASPGALPSFWWTKLPVAWMVKPMPWYRRRGIGPVMMMGMMGTCSKTGAKNVFGESCSSTRSFSSSNRDLEDRCPDLAMILVDLWGYAKGNVSVHSPGTALQTWSLEWLSRRILSSSQVVLTWYVQTGDSRQTLTALRPSTTNSKNAPCWLWLTVCRPSWTPTWSQS